MCTSDLSQGITCKFHYEYIKNNNGTKSQLLFIDYKTLMFNIKTKGIYENFSDDKEML